MENQVHPLIRKALRLPASAGAALWRKPGLLLSAATILMLLPFVHKAFCIDDPLFLWAARHIQADPLDFYGFDVNWLGRSAPMYRITENPPFDCYYIALIASLFGWSEFSLHVAFIIPAIAAVLGTYQLARHFCARPVVAALAALLTPAFLVSSTNVMCDTMMVALWVWTLVYWEKGLREDRLSMLAAAGALAGICALTKYFGMCLIPLMLVAGIVKRRKPGAWIAAILVPIAMLAAYQWWTKAHYGRGLLLNAAGYAIHYQARYGRGFLGLGNMLPGLAFAGGGLFTAATYAGLLWGRRNILLGVAAAALATAMLWHAPLNLMPNVNQGFLWLAVAQLAAFALAGAAILLLAALDLARNRDADSMLLFLWVAGTFLFAAVINWTVNERSILPMAPAVGILLMRRLDFRRGTPGPAIELQVLWPLVPAALLALLVAGADYRLANSARTAAYLSHEEAQGLNGSFWFQGHWGFQYYIEQLGDKPLDLGTTHLHPGDLLVTPANAAYPIGIPQEFFRMRKVIVLRPNWFLSTMDRFTASGFYNSGWGPLPFAAGPVAPERYTLAMVINPVSAAGAPAK
jgi:4-amino-4-deoxy-L-arabinose transferase-like glycosyltransferase